MADAPPEAYKRKSSRRLASFRVENEYDPEIIPQYFQVTVNVLEAKKLAWANPQTATSYVVVSLGKKRRRTDWRKNMEEPYYREYFVFELYTSLRDILRKNMRLAVMESRCCGPARLLGEANIDLSAIWTQPHHQVFHKWAQLIQPKNLSAGIVGYLKLDIAILYRGESQYIPVTVQNSNIEENLLLPSGSIQQRANYVITIYNAYALPSGSRCYGERRYGKPPDTFVKVTFSGLTAKTAIQHRNTNPAYNEILSIVEMFPNMSQDIHIEVWSNEGYVKKVVCGTYLRLNDISNDSENGFLPTFGPSLLPMYSKNSGPAGLSATEDGPYYKGSLLIALNTQVPYYLQGLRTVKVQSAIPLNPDSIWSLEEFCVYCPIFEVSMIDKKVVGGSCGVAITIGEVPLEKKFKEDFLTYMEEIKNKKLYHTGPMEVQRGHSPYGHLEFMHAYPVLEVATRLPDFRFRMYRNNMVYWIVLNLESTVFEVERRLKSFDYKKLSDLIYDLDVALEDTAGNIIKFLQTLQDISQSSEPSEELSEKYGTDLDKKQMKLQKEEIESIYRKIANASKTSTSTNFTTSKNYRKLNYTQMEGAGDALSRKTVKRRLLEMYDLLEKLRSLIFKSFEGWPSVVIWLLDSGSRVAYTKVSAADIIYSPIAEQRGHDCGRIQSVFMKPLSCPKHMTTLSTGCFCLAAKVELSLWMGLFSERSFFSETLPQGYRIKTKDVDMCLTANVTILEFRAFIYRGKLSGGLDNTGLADPFVRINIFSTSMDTETKWKTLTPVWNQVLKIRSKVFTSNERLDIYPPVVLVEVYDKDPGDSIELMGRMQITPVLDNRIDYEFAPKLRWYDVFKGIEHTGQILMSVQLLQNIPEKEIRTLTYDSIDDLVITNVNAIEKHNSDEYIEVLPENLIPETTTYKLDVYWWGLRDMASTRKPCAVLEMDELVIKSQMISQKKKNSNFPGGKSSQVFEAPQNEVYCPPLSVRLYDSGTFGRTIFVGTNVIKNPNKYLIRWLPKEQREASIRSSSLSIHICQVSQKFHSTNQLYEKTQNTQDEKSSFSNLFRKSPLAEEEHILLPLFTRKEKQNYAAFGENVSSESSKDWWLRYFCSHSMCTPEEKVSESDHIMIYNGELERQPQFSKFKDWCATFKLYSGKKTGIPDKDEQLYCGFIKAGIALYKWPPPDNTVAVSPSGVNLDFGFFDDHPSNDPSKFLVRVYIVKGFNLMAKDFTGKSDPYVILKCGKKTLGERKYYIPNTLNPIFGRVYEFQSSFPDDYLLTVFVYDYDTVPPDDLIGCTSIDLEDRVYSKHRPTCGLSTEYSTSGANKWRDYIRPSAILEELCLKNHIPGPTFPDNSTVIVDGVKYNYPKDDYYTSTTDLTENICLNILHKWDSLPICGFPLVPEHIETRTLYNQDKPGLDQGKLQMWIDIFPLDTGHVIPPPVDITPQKLVEYELRIIIWDTEGIKLDDFNLISSQRSSDIYVKAWIGQYEKAQKTDIHYRSLTGVGNFNWRMVFHFIYQHAERKMVIKGTGMFGNQEEHVIPLLVVQVMDSDAITADDFLGSLSLNLNAMPRGAKLARQANLSLLEKSKKINLFRINSIRGWWPLKMRDNKTGLDMPAGVIDLELTLLPKEKAIYMPVGLGREGPHPLPLPKRPETSFNIYTNPFLTLKTFMRSKGYKSIIIVLGAVLSVFMLVSVISNLPRILLEKWLKR